MNRFINNIIYKIMSNVTLLTTPTCTYCVALRRFLDEKGIKYNDVDVSADMKAQEEMISRTGQASVPVLYIDDQVVVGFDRKKICELLNINDCA